MNYTSGALYLTSRKVSPSVPIMSSPIVGLVPKYQNEGMPRKTGWTNLEASLLKHLALEPAYAFLAAQDLKRSRQSTDKALKRLDSMGLVRGKWDTGDGRQGPPRRVYTLTAKGRREHAKITDSG